MSSEELLNNIDKDNDCTKQFRKAYENRYTWDSSFPGYEGNCVYSCGSLISEGTFTYICGQASKILKTELLRQLLPIFVRHLNVLLNFLIL